MTEGKYGRSGGVPLTDELLAALVEEAEHGYEPERLARRPSQGRPPLGSKAATVFQVRLPPALHAALDHAAQVEETTPSDIVRKALRLYLIGETFAR
jgi:hypothetical protein